MRRRYGSISTRKPARMGVPSCLRRLGIAAMLALVAIVSGCSHGPAQTVGQTDASEPGVFVLREIAAQQAWELLSRFHAGEILISPERNALILSGSRDQLHRAAIVLDLIDSHEPYAIETIAPVSAVRSVPTNEQIAGVLGEIEIGTFASPPRSTGRARAIIDIHDQSVVAIAPVRLFPRLLATAGWGGGGPGPAVSRMDVDPLTSADDAESVGVVCRSSLVARNDPPPAPLGTTDRSMPAVEQPAWNAAVDREESSDVRQATSDESPRPRPLGPAETGPQWVTHVLSTACAGDSISESFPFPAIRDSSPVGGPSEMPRIAYGPLSFPNGDDVLQLDLPENIELMELLDLAAEYLHLDYMCDPKTLAGQTVSLRLHGKLRGEMRVKDLYPLLESVLKFKGYAMTRHRDNLVLIVPVERALEADPELIGDGPGAMRAGDMVVTRLFGLRHVTTATAGGLLERMKLSMAVSPIEETQTLIVTGYAYRMERIEQLLALVDRPGRPREFRTRQLQYALAGAIIGKIEAVVAELHLSPVRAAPAPARRTGPSSPVVERGISSRNPEPTVGRAVYLDADERTNRILMVGYAEELVVIESAIDAFDLPRQDPRIPKTYPIRRLRAADVLTKLEELEVIGVWLPAAPTSGAGVSSIPRGLEVFDTTQVELPQVAVIEPTNALLINATHEQHVWIATIIEHIDAAPEDPRTLRVYDIRHIDAAEVKRKLGEFEVIHGVAGPAAAPPAIPAARTDASGSTRAPAAFEPNRRATGDERRPLAQPRVMVLETTNSLLVHATDEQQLWIQDLIARIDVEVRQEAIPYEIYFLENQEPERLAEILQRIIQETIRDKEGKLEKVVRRTDEEIVIVPDPGTFSLIVYANRKNQDWINKLVRSLDKRRPQVLIDVTLVEITRMEAFTYDLNWIQGFPDLAVTSGVTGALVPSPAAGPPVRLPRDVTNTLERTGRDRLIDVQSDSGNFRGFYGDRHINVLLQAMASKNYGRVLARPKVLVNDNEPGAIKTADITYVEVKSSIPIGTGGAGPDVTLIETARKFEPYEAGIELKITPHISEGDLLRLKIELTRSDFLQAGSLVRPPDTRANELTTTVTVPDGSTIILGGLLKLNQNKSSRKVPLLGDIPLIGGLFRGIDNRDAQSNLYIFVKAEVIRPAGLLLQRMEDLEDLSRAHREAFEQHERQFQDYQTWPGLRPRPVPPERALEAR
jgi:type II secretory pathway component GspD/PulD (secretin)